jgi:(p)ppGpp synthase/HD superfamily hydrolase
METMAALCFEECNGDLTIQCAILHDVLEDTKITNSEIQTEFGDQVAKGVMALTKNTSLEKSLQMKDSLQRIQNEPREIAMVKMADRICNLDTPPHYWKQEKIIQYLEEAREIYNALSSKNNYLGNRLMKKIEEYCKYIH